MAKSKFYRLNQILKHDAQYNIIFGERSSGKTFAVLEYGIKNFCSSGKQLAIVRRWEEDFKGKRGQTMFDSLVSAGVVEKASGGEFTNVYYFASKWYLCRYEDGERITDNKPFALIVTSLFVKASNPFTVIFLQRYTYPSTFVSGSNIDFEFPFGCGTPWSL